VLVNINALIVKTSNAVHLEGAQEIERTYSIDNKLPPINCDPSKIQQVIVHVITNAIQAILDRKKILADNEPYRGSIAITTQKKADHVLITFTDNGIGIREEHRSKIFNPFFSTRPAGQGTGLGLSISHKIVEEHGGRMFFDCVDRLTCFSVLLPFQRNQRTITDTID
jgi:two-component system, NtrC family, sensor kinase